MSYAADWTCLLDSWIDQPDLTASSADAAARLIADSLICGLAGSPLKRSRLLREHLFEAAGAAEAWVAGGDRKLPASAAAAANAEAMNLLDADDSFLNISHFGALLVAVALAEGERVDADWSQICRATALGFDLNARLALAARVEPGYFAPGLMLPGAALTAALAGGADADASSSPGRGGGPPAKPVVVVGCRPLAGVDTPPSAPGQRPGSS